MARTAKKLGVELFVLDDGWFKNRVDDKRALGDWTVDKKKIKHGLDGLSKRIKKIGLDFGIWIEPEMVNEDSTLYRAHKEWALRDLNKSHSLGRNQMILDLTNDDVIDYLYKSIQSVIEEAKPSYIKWDMNRIFSDYYSNNLDKNRMKELNHRYYLGLYKLFRMLKEKYPKILIEGCASGGNRFDLGILSYCPEIWASDDTDASVRMNMEYNYSYGYPLSTLGCHTASSPTTSTLRRINLDTRFNAAFLGAFGYEIDLRHETKESKKEIKKEIEFYKTIKNRLLDIDYYRIDRSNDKIDFLAVSKDKTIGFLIDYNLKYKPINPYNKIKLMGFDETKNYNVSSNNKTHNIKMFGETINMISPIKIKDGGIIQNIISKFYKLKDGGLELKTNGSILNNEGLNINESFSGSGINDKMRLMFDNDSRLYIIKME